MNKPADAIVASAIELRYGQIGLLQGRLRSTDPGALLDELSGRVATAPQFFQQTALCLDLGALADPPDAAAVRQVMETVRRAGMITVGLAEGAPHIAELGKALSLPVLSGFRGAAAGRGAPAAPRPVETRTEPTVGMQHAQPVRSGQRVYARDRDLIVTAAHCLLDAGDVAFVPGYRDGEAPYGVWKVAKVFLPDGWTQGRDEDSDVAFAALEEQDGAGVEDVVGGNRFAPGTATGATAVTVTGYPNAAEAPIRCVNKPTAHTGTQQRIACPGFSGGTSGSPWVNGYGEVVGILGGHEQGGSTDDVSYSVVLGPEAAELYREAASDS